MRRLGASVCVVALFSVLVVPRALPRPVSRSSAASNARDSALVVAMNAARAAHGLPALRFDVRLTRAARFHSMDMLRRHYFAHGNFGARMWQFRCRGRLFAENLDWGSGIVSANEAVADWLASPVHRENLLDPTLRRVGVATPVGAFGGYSRSTMITADFAGG
jgi:uncharacterized protein YkwD